MVQDGHGVQGHLVSSRIVQTLQWWTQCRNMLMYSEPMPLLRYSLAHSLQSCEVWFPRRSSPRLLEKHILVLPGNQIPHCHCLRLSAKKNDTSFQQKRKPFVFKEAAFDFAEKAPVAELNMIEN